MNLTLMTKQDDQWVYRTPDQYELVQACREILGWDLYVFDCWLYDDRNWSMYTSGRQSMIASREDLARGYPAVREDRSEATFLLAGHCVTVWHCTRKPKMAQHRAVEEMELAYSKARGIKRPAVPSDRVRRNSIAPGAATYGHFQTMPPSTAHARRYERYGVDSHE